MYCSLSRAAIVTSFFITITALAEDPEASADTSAAEFEGRVIGRVSLAKSDVFDLSDPRENKRLYRLANRLHIMTKDRVIEQQLLLGPGDVYSKQLADESARILRRNAYLYDVSIKPMPRADDKVDLEVSTRDVWTLQPVLSLSRTGGENETAYGFEEINLLGRGQRLRVKRSEDEERDSNIIEFRDPNIGNSWVAGRVLFADSSDGESRFLSVTRPFFALNTHWSAGVSAFDDDREATFYELGDPVAEYRHERQRYSAFGGWSSGRRNGWVRRYTAGFVIDDNRFSEVVEGTRPALVPPDRDLRYPFLGIEIFADDFETSRNRQQIARTEDFFMGTRVAAQVGWASEDFGSDRDALIYSASVSEGLGTIDKQALLLSARASGRIESGDTRNAIVSLDARFFHQQSDRRVFFATISGAHGHALDPENTIELGGDSGLRGYPLRYQAGNSRVLFTAEQRYYWDWYPWRLFRVGGAIFADVGRVWGDDPVQTENLGWLRDAGIGLRFASTRSDVRKVIHLDIAFPIDGDASIDDVQVLLESKRSF